VWFLARSGGNGLVVVLAVEDPQNGQKEVEDIQIETDGRSNLFFHVVMAKDKLRIDQYVSTEDQCPNHAISQFNLSTMGEKRGHEAKEDKSPQRCEKVWNPAREIIFCLACE